MPSTWVLKLQQVDRPEQPILVHVTQKSGSTYDLDLLATDGEEAYRGKVRQRNLAKLRSTNFDGTDEDWTALLHYALVSKQSSNLSQERMKSSEVDCSISGRGSKAILAITLRSRIEDITHRLGTIELSYSENTDDVDLFGWACIIADQRNGLEDQVTLKNKEAEHAETTMTSLQSQLTDLVQAKQEHEDQLLSKFALLLNEKKLKIRNQQRILATAKIDHKKLNEVQSAMKRQQTSPGSDNGSKRKHDKMQPQEVPEDDESDGFEAMDVDGEPPHGGGGEPGTPDRSDTETATEDEDEDDLDDARQSDKLSQQNSKTASRRMSPPPPPRTLPFQKKGPGSALSSRREASKPTSTDDDEETASEDDEL